ncbi:unnamed protein product [Brachionus calyciflorus]|uniref:Fungal lipase-type domain-containing protein n=1 Tax=Brachionus calyciflorus TaxID=104777 RepID=A0A814CVV1_9BILA|nr:unnamed protein product [Brachionus calyciflorus]
MVFSENRQKINHIIEKIRNNDYDYSCLDLQRIFLEDFDISRIENLLINNNFVCNVKWNTKNKNIYSIEKLIARNLIKFRRYPSDYVHGLLSKHVNFISQFSKNEQVFFKKIPDIDKNECLNRDRMLRDWSLEDIYTDQSLESYKGALYINKKQRQVVLASKGNDTFLEFLSVENSSVNTNIETVLIDNLIKPISHAFKLAEKIYNKWVLKEKYNLSFTGHSLGGWYASMQCFHLQYDKKIDNVKAVVFDSPGISFENFSNNPDFLSTNFKLNSLNIITYLSMPNVINTCNFHCGKKSYLFKLDESVTGIVSNPYHDTILGYYLPCHIFNLEHHKLDTMLEYFDSQTGEFKNYDNVKEVLDWPCLKKNIENDLLRGALDYWLTSKAMKLSVLNLTASLITVYNHIKPKVRSSFSKLKSFFSPNDEKSVIPYEGCLMTEPLDLTNGYLSKNQIDSILHDAYYSPLDCDDFMSRFINSLIKTFTLDCRTISLNPYRELQFKGEYFKSIDDLRQIVSKIISLENIELKIKMSRKGLCDQFLCVDLDLELNKFFVKRPAVIDQLNKEYARNDVVIIHGIPGIGKTEITRYYALNQERSFFFLDAQTIQTFNTDLKNISNIFEINYNQENINYWYEQIFTRLRKYEAIFFIENLSDKEPKIKEFLIQILRNNWCNNFKIFVINRTEKINESFKSERVSCFKIPGLKFSEIKEFFEDKYLLKRDFSNNKLKETITELGDGTFISAFNSSKMLDFILNNPNRTSKEVLLYIKNHAINFIDQELYENIYNSLDPNFRIEFLKLISILDKNFISIDFLADLLRKYERIIIMNQLDLLADLGLIEIVNDGSAIRVDSLFRSDLRIFIKHKDSEIFKDENLYLNENKNFTNRLINYLIQGFKSECLFHVFSNWIYKNNYIEKNTYLIEYLNNMFSSKMDILDQLNQFYFYECLSFSKIVSNDFKMALSLYKKGIEILEKIFNEQNLILANALYNLAILYDYNGYYEISLLYHETCLKMRRELHENKDHSDLVISLVGTGCINQKLGFLTKAYEFKKQAFEMANRVEKQPSYLTAYTQLELGFVNFEMGKLCDFETLNENSINDRIDFFSANLDLDITYLWAYDAFLLEQKFDKSFDYFKKCMNTKSDILKSLLFEKISHFYFNMGNYVAALSCCQESIKIKSQIYSNEHPQLAISYGFEAQILIQNREKLENIRDILTKALQIEQIFFQEKSPNRIKVSVYSALADFYDYAKNFDKALSYRTKAFIFSNILNKENLLDLAKVQNELGLTLQNLGNLNDSAKCLKDSLATIEKIENFSFKKNLLEVEILKNYGMVLKAVNENKHGFYLIKKSLDLRKKIFIDNNLSDIANFLKSLEYKSYNLEDKGLCVENIRKSDLISSEFFDIEKRNYIQSLISLSNDYKVLNDLDEMLKLLKEARTYAANISYQHYIVDIDKIILNVFSP